MKSLLGEAASWLIGAAILGGTLLYFEELRARIAAGLGIAVNAPHNAARTAASVSDDVQKRSGRVELTAQSDGHFYTRAEINGRPAHVMIDTGASMVALTYEDAERAGVRVKPHDFTHPVKTANGTARFALVELEGISIGSITVRNVQAAIAERGRLSISLLGMSFLSRLERVDMRQGTLVLVQ